MVAKGRQAFILRTFLRMFGWRMRSRLPYEVVDLTPINPPLEAYSTPIVGLNQDCRSLVDFFNFKGLHLFVEMLCILTSCSMKMLIQNIQINQKRKNWSAVVAMAISYTVIADFNGIIHSNHFYGFISDQPELLRPGFLGDWWNLPETAPRTLHCCTLLGGGQV